MNKENKFSAIMYHKKIRRLMAKYDLVAKVRKANLNRKKWLRILKKCNFAKLLNREFEQGEPKKVLLTEITISLL